MQRDLSLPWLLVATPQLRDENFRRAVVLIVEDNAQGTMGFVINRPLRTPVSEIIHQTPSPIPSSVPAWYGGPVATSAGVIVHHKAQPCHNEPMPPSDLPLRRRELGVSADEKTLLDLAQAARTRIAEIDVLEAMHGRGATLASDSILYPYRFVVGYAGWSPGQLDSELRSGAWIQVPATSRLVFGTAWSKLWEVALGSMGIVPQALAPTGQIYLN